MSENAADRRRFKRIAFNARTELHQQARTWSVQLLDLSLKGLLIQRPQPWQGDPGEAFDVDIHLAPDTPVHMRVRLAHDDHGQLGFVCEHIDLASISHLRRLVELNLGDPQELERELGALIDIP